MSSQYELPKLTPNIKPTHDDLQILLEVYRHDVIDAHTIRLLLSHRSPDGIGRRLNLLRKNRFLVRLKQLEEIFRPGGGSYSKAYTLGESGYLWIKNVLALPPKKLRHNERASRLTATTIKHALEQTRILVAIRKSVSIRPNLEFLYPEQIYERFAPKILERKVLPRVLQTKVHWHGHAETEGTIPDGFFMIVDPTKPDGKQRRTIFLEIDRGTMTVMPSDQKLHTEKFWRDNSMLRKFLVYEFAFRTNAHKRQFGIERFQVLTVTNSAQHAVRMQAMYQKHLTAKPLEANPYRYLFTDFETIKKRGYAMLDVPIQNGVGQMLTLSP